MNHRIDISYKTIFFTAAFLALLWALFLIRDVIILLFVAIILMSGLSPMVGFFQTKLKVPRALAISITYLIVFSILAVLISLVVTPLIDQTSKLLVVLPLKIEELLPSLQIDQSLLQQEISNFSKNAFSFTLEIFGGFVAFVSVAVLTFYMLLERENLDKLIAQFFIGRQERIKKVTERIEDKLGSWLRGQFILSVIIGTLCYLVLFILNIPYALPLAILAGIFEVLPVIGPIISAIPAIIIAYVTAPVLALMVGVSYLIIQQAESHLIVPQVMKKAVGLNPLVVILAVAIGGRLLGIAGALLAVPITVVIQIITQDVLKEEV